MSRLTHSITKQWSLAIDDFKNKGCNFNHIEEMNIITIANKMDMSYDF